MIIVLRKGCTAKQIAGITRHIEELGFKAHVSKGVERTVIGAIGGERGKEGILAMEGIPWVEKVVPILQPYKLASSEFRKDRTVVTVGKAKFGGGHVSVIAGPCSVESEKQIIKSAIAVKRAGAKMLRGGAFKPRTSPYSFQGLEEEGLKLLAKARKESGLPFVTEVINSETAKLVSDYADMLQIGARNAQNFSLLRTIGKLGRPVLLKRGLSSTIQEFLMAAEYILSEGCKELVLCERGIRTFETATRNTLDISAIPVIQERSHLPIIIDPSHAAGVRKYIAPLSYAAIAAGADGLIVEVHPDPSHALCDGAQSLDPDQFNALMSHIKALDHFNKTHA